jgi:hypothetical protein
VVFGVRFPAGPHPSSAALSISGSSHFSSNGQVYIYIYIFTPSLFVENIIVKMYLEMQVFFFFLKCLLHVLVCLVVRNAMEMNRRKFMCY